MGEVGICRLAKVCGLMSPTSGWRVYEKGCLSVYDAHVCCFFQQGKPLKVLQRSFKKLEGRVVFYGGLPQARFHASLLTQHPCLGGGAAALGAAAALAG